MKNRLSASKKGPHLVIKTALMPGHDHYGRSDRVMPQEPRGEAPNSSWGRSTESGRLGAGPLWGRSQEQARVGRSRARQLGQHTTALGASACHPWPLRVCVERTYSIRVLRVMLVVRELSGFSETHLQMWSDPQAFSSPSKPMSPARSGRQGGRKGLRCEVPVVSPRAEDPCATLGEETHMRQYGKDAGRAPGEIRGGAWWTHVSSLSRERGLSSAWWEGG